MHVVNLKRLPSNSLVGKLLHAIKLLLHVASLVSFFLQVRKSLRHQQALSIMHQKKKKKLRYVAAIVPQRSALRPLLVTTAEQFSWLNPVALAVTIKRHRGKKSAETESEDLQDPHCQQCQSSC